MNTDLCSTPNTVAMPTTFRPYKAMDDAGMIVCDQARESDFYQKQSD